MMDISERMIFSVVRTIVEPPKDELQGNGENICTTKVSTNTRFVSSRLNTANVCLVQVALQIKDYLYYEKFSTSNL